MIQALMQSFKTRFASVPDTSKASELVLLLNGNRARTTSDSPEFTVRKVIPHRILHTNNPRVKNQKGYEFVGCLVRAELSGTIRTVPAHLVCGDRAWSLFRRGEPFAAILCYGTVREFISARPQLGLRSMCSTFPLDSFGQTKNNLAEIT